MGGVLTVTELTARIKASLEGAFRSVRVEGEISNYKLYPSGHRYFTLKDEGAQVRVVLFRGRERFIIGETRDGQTVIVSGSLGVYEKKGEYQIYAQSVEVRGLGSLLLELEKRKVRLAAEGLFDPERKRPLPPFPERIGIVPSPPGAALRELSRGGGARRAARHHRETLRREFRILAGALVDPRPLLQARRYALAKSTDALAERMQEISRRSRERVSDLTTALRLGAPGAWGSRKRGGIAVLLEGAVPRR